MFYYNDYSPETNTRRVLSYDAQKHGMPRVIFECTTMLYHNSLIISRVYDTAVDALAAWGKYSNKPVIMPDGSETTPARYFGVERIEDIFIQWGDVKGERWPGEY